MTTKNILSSLVLLALPSLLAAQIGIGVQGGFLSSRAKIENTSGTSSEEVSDAITGYTVGIPVELSLGNAFALQTGVNYLRRGYNNASVANNSIETYYNTFEIPLLGKVGYVGEAFTLAGVFGPSYQYTTSATIESDIAGVVNEFEVEFDDARFDNIKRSNLFGNLGVQLGLPIGIGKIIVDGRYKFQLNDEDGGDDVEIRGRGIAATAGILVTLGDY